MRKSFDDNRHNIDFEKYSDEEFEKESHKVISYSVNIIAGERYRHKAKTIEEWVDKDRNLQERYDSAMPHNTVICTLCGSRTRIVHKGLFDTEQDHPLILFMFECASCHKRQAFYDNGTPFERKPSPCPMCSSPLSNTVTHEDEVMTTVTVCASCQYRDVDIYDFKKSREERDAREAKEKQLLSEYRSQFCWDEKNRATVPQYYSWTDNLS